jgi:hypothetical protein
MTYYLNVGLFKTGEKDPKKLNIYKTPISRETYLLLRSSRFNWFSTGLSNDMKNPDGLDTIEGHMTDIFFIVVESIIENKLGLGPKEYIFDDQDYNENEIMVDIYLG